jgi:hypothetical protein
MKRRSKDFLTGATPQKNEALIQDGLANMTLVSRQADRKKMQVGTAWRIWTRFNRMRGFAGFCGGWSGRG